MKKSIINLSIQIGIVMFLCIVYACQKDNPKPADPVPVLTFSTPAALSCSSGCSNAATSSIAGGGAITYAISNQSVSTGVASVDVNTGAITPIAAGTATVTATQAALAGKNATGTATYTLTITGLSITSFDPIMGGVGYSVTITGTNFDGTTPANNVVKINGVQTATPTKVSSTSLTVLVPKGAQGAGDISVTVGSKTASKGTFTEYATVTTLAGDGTQHFNDATGTAAQFYNPSGLVIDLSGNLLVADGSNNRIRSITLPGAVVTTIAGNGTSDYSEGQGTDAQFANPYGITVNPRTGDIYFTAKDDDHVWKINSDGYVSIYAGSTEGYSNGTSLTTAQFYQPQGIAIDAFDNLYVTDRWNSYVRELLPGGSGNGTVLTLGGNGTSTYLNGPGNTSGFYFPDGIVVAPDGNSLYVADHSNGAIRQISIDGIVNVTTLAGKSQADAQAANDNTDGTGTVARFSGPSGLAVDAAGNLYVADNGNDLIRKITPAGVVTTIAGGVITNNINYVDGLGPFARIYAPTGIAVDADGTIYVSDGTSRIRKIVP